MMKFGLREIPVWTFRTLCLFLGGFGVLGIAKAGGVKLTIPRSEFWPLILVSLLNITGWQLILGGIPVIIGAFILESMTALLHVSWQAALATGYVILVVIFSAFGHG
jgi:hypothetical protein